MFSLLLGMRKNPLTITDLYVLFVSSIQQPSLLGMFDVVGFGQLGLRCELGDPVKGP